jgi:hypothetical protein
VSDVGQDLWYDSFIYHGDITANLVPGDYLFVLNTNGVPSLHNPGASESTNIAVNRKYMICLRNKSSNAHLIW